MHLPTDRIVREHVLRTSRAVTYSLAFPFLLALIAPCLLPAPLTATPLLPDLFPWADQSRSYMYNGIFDTSYIQNKVLYRFHGVLPNIGAGPVELREVTHADQSQDVYQRIYQSEGGVTETLIGTFPNADGPYGHLYLVGIAQYNLRTVLAENGVGPVVSTHDKISYALVDSTAYNTSLPGAPPSRHYDSTNDPLLGISVGWADIYSRTTHGQWADATGLPSGQYWLEVIADPYNRIQESNETNNTTRILVNLTIPEPLILPGDYNQDGAVNAADYTVWRNRLGTTVARGTAADGNGDGRITADDYPVWKLQYGETEEGSGASSNQVPEPTAATLAAFLIAMLAGCRTAQRHRE